MNWVPMLDFVRVIIHQPGVVAKVVGRMTHTHTYTHRHSHTAKLQDCINNNLSDQLWQCFHRTLSLIGYSVN